MGCSPSKGNNFGTLGPTRKSRMLPPAPQESPRQSQFEDRENHNSTASTDGDTKEKKTAGQTQVFQKEAHMTPQKKRSVTELAPESKQKVDFPEPLVKAHQAAYAFLNPSINKYDVLLGLLEQAAQTQVSVQPMVAFMALRYEEIIQGLEEIADEGEKVLKENGEHLACLALLILSPHQICLQQLLQYTTQRMRNVGQTVGGIGDSALEEAAEYFASVSELLEEKLKVKRAVETRLMQLLSRIEMASLRKPGPEDCALFSEDSGIGAESESLAGSERRHRRESWESTGTNRTTPVSPMGYTSTNFRKGVSRQKFLSQISPSVSLTSLNSLGSTCTIMANDQRDSLLGSVSLDDGEEEDNDDDEEEEMGETQVRFRKRSNSSPVNREQHPRRLPPKRIENPQNVEMTLKMKNAISGRIQFIPSQNPSAKTKVAGSPKTSRRQWADEEERSPRRPQTAALVRRAVVKKTPVSREQRSRSAESLRSKGEDHTLLELERTQKDLNQRLQRMSKSKAAVNTRTAPSKQNQGNSPAQSSSNKSQASITRKEHPPSSPRPSSGLHRGRNSVRKLIDTFSQGIEELDSPKVLGPLKGVRKCGVPVLPGLGNMEAVLSAGITSCRSESISSEKTDDLDLDSLPPPPLEVLMDNSFEGAQSLSTSVADDGATKVGKSPVLKRTVVSQRLRASVQSVTVLPSKGGLPQASKVISLARADQQHTSTPSKVIQPDAQLEAEPGKEKDSLYQQARKIIHLRHSSDSQKERSSTSYIETNPPASQEESTDSQNGGNLSVPGPNTMVSVQPTPPSSASPPVSRKLPTPAAERRLPSPPVAKQNILSSNSTSSYPFKAPSPPASPKVQRWSRENSSEDSSSTRMTNNARSVFCPASPSLFEAQPFSVPRPPQAWTSTGMSFLSRPLGSRARFPVSVQGPRPFIRRSHSDRRPSLSLPPRSPGISVAETCGSEPAICSQG
uniref:Photoreceptor cilium actin regulator n=1 Tax=Lates calcarifer TaxID=8187 RepID=A0A4W6F8X8_LATCA